RPSAKRATPLGAGMKSARRTGADVTVARRPERRFRRSSWALGSGPGSSVAIRITSGSSIRGSMTVAYSRGAETTCWTIPASGARPTSRLTCLPSSSSTCTSPVAYSGSLLPKLWPMAITTCSSPAHQKSRTAESATPAPPLTIFLLARSSTTSTVLSSIGTVAAKCRPSGEILTVWSRSRSTQASRSTCARAGPAASTSAASAATLASRHAAGRVALCMSPPPAQPRAHPRRDPSAPDLHPSRGAASGHHEHHRGPGRHPEAAIGRVVAGAGGAAVRGVAGAVHEVQPIVLAGFVRHCDAVLAPVDVDQVDQVAEAGTRVAASVQVRHQHGRLLCAAGVVEAQALADLVGGAHAEQRGRSADAQQVAERVAGPADVGRHRHDRRVGQQRRHHRPVVAIVRLHRQADAEVVAAVAPVQDVEPVA